MAQSKRTKQIIKYINSKTDGKEWYIIKEFQPTNNYLYAHKFTYDNKDEIASSKLCGCCYCLKIFNSKIVKNWSDDKTALCPYCGIDSVMGDKKVNINNKLLQNMNKYYFSITY